MKGFDGLQFDAGGLVDGSEVGNDLGGFVVGDGEGACLAVEEPAQDLFGSGPDAVKEELLVGDGILHGAASETGGREDVMDGVKEGAADV
mmetsp:Transcript_27617/g.66379  ORF Transcript_27617/g.66379 Transcript_27617/m.66379 type:complete len:90 (-) Transcript_27617:132-401(-)